MGKRLAALLPSPGTLLSLILFYLSSPQFGAWGALVWVALIPLFWSLSRCAGPRELLKECLWFQAGRWLGALSWFTVATPLVWRTGLVGSLALYVVFTFLATMHYPLYAFLRRRFARADQPLMTALTLAAIFTLLEWALSPFNFTLGHGLYGHPFFLSLNPWVGTTALSFLIVLVAEVALRASWQKLLMVVVVTVAIFEAGNLLRPWSEARQLKVLAVSPGVDFQEGLSANRRDGQRDYVAAEKILALLADEGRSNADITLFPESIVPMSLTLPRDAREQELAQRFKHAIDESSSSTVLGETHIGTDGASNDIVVYPQGKVFTKRELMPLGEYVPLTRSFPALRGVFFSAKMVVGRDIPHVTEVAGVKVAFLNCSEVFSPRLAATQAARGAQAQFLLGNEAVLSGSSAPDFILAAAVMRSTETALPFVKVSNQGLSGVVMSDGEFEMWSSPGVRLVHLGAGQASFYARHPSLFLWFMTLLLAVGAAATMWGAKKRHSVH